MVFFNDSKIESVMVSTVGNKLLEESFNFSGEAVGFDNPDDGAAMMFTQFFQKPFSKADQVYHFYHAQDFLFNVVGARVYNFFEGEASLADTAFFLTGHLYDVSDHPKIRAGEFYVVHFKDVHFEGELCEAIGLYKSDNKEAFLSVNISDHGVSLIAPMNAMRLDGLDKAALIIKNTVHSSYKVLIGGCKNAVDSAYWKDDFLVLAARQDAYQKTRNLMTVCKNFIMEKLDDQFEVEKADKIDLLNRTVAHFKDHDTLNMEEFEHEVLQGEQVIEAFQTYRKNFEEENEVSFGDEFAVSSTAVKKMRGGFKSVIKLDKNATIQLHGKRDLVERGFDEDKGMSYYKVYFENEG